MKYQVIETFKVKTSQGEMELQAGQIITLPQDKAIRLLNEGKITPIERVAYKIYSELLGCYLWVVDTDKDIHSLRSQGIKEAIYTADEIKKFKGIDKDSLREIHRVKELFEFSKVDSFSGGIQQTNKLEEIVIEGEQ